MARKKGKRQYNMSLLPWTYYENSVNHPLSDRTQIPNHKSINKITAKDIFL